MAETCVTPTPPTAVTTQRSGPAATVPAAPQAVPPPSRLAKLVKHRWLLLIGLAVIGGLAYTAYILLRPAKLPEGFASSNGRIEATEVDVATKLAGRIIDELVDEGAFVTAGQVVAHMDTDKLQAERREAEAKREMALSAVATAKSTLAQRESEKVAAEAVVSQRQAEFDLANRLYERGKQMLGSSPPAISNEDFDTRRSAFFAATAAPGRSKA